MKLAVAREEFIQTWGALGSSWGINRTMSSIHALLMSSSKPLSTEDIMDYLKISRGNANMNVRALIDWGLVKRQLVAGERKDFFSASNDPWEIARQVTAERRKRELGPVIETVGRLKNIDEKNEEALSFKALMENMEDFTTKVDSTLSTFTKADKSWFFKTLMKLVR
jgi:DNA-binding transcriptional regulator GbsR (MarR family)